MSAEAEGYVRVRHPWLVQVAVSMGTLLTTMDTGSVNVSLHTIATSFAVDDGTVAWLPLTLFLIVTSTLLLFGRVSDMIGAKLVLLAGFAVYALGSLLAGLAASFPMLLAFRVVQAVGVAMLSANMVAILTECFPPRQRGTVLGINSTVVGLGYFVGPILSGFLIRELGWRYVFFAGVPLCAVGLVIGMLVLPRSRTMPSRFDFVGAALFALAAVSLLLAINAARSASPTSPAVLALGAATVLATGGFLAVEQRVAEPMVDLGLFRRRLFSLSLTSAFCLFIGITGQDFLVPLFVQQILLQDPMVTGMAIATVPFVRMLASSPSGILTDRFGSRWLSGLGAALTALGLFGLSRMDAGTSMAYLVLCLLSIGLGTGIFFSPNMHAIMASVPPGRLGVGSGALGLRRNLGQSLGVGLAAYLLQTGSGGTVAQAPGFQLAFSVQAVAVVLATVAALAAGSTLSARQRRAVARAAE